MVLPSKRRKKHDGQWKAKSKQDLLLEFKNFIQSKSSLKNMFFKQLSEKNANPASSMISTGATPNSMRKPASFEPASDSGMALDGKRNLNWYWSLTASGASLVGWNGPLTEEQIDRWEFLAAQGITVSRATFAEDKNKLMKLMKTMNARRTKKKTRKIALTICGPFAKRHFKSMKAKKTVAQTNRSHGD